MFNNTQRKKIKCLTKMEQVLEGRDQKQEDKWETVKEQNLRKTLKEIAEDKEDVETIQKNKMPRPCKRRRVRGRPNSNLFKPAGIPFSQLEEIELSLGEFEAIRLIDFEKISQEMAGKKMQISQPTLSRNLQSAREKIAEAIIKGKAIKIEKSDI